MTDDPEAFAAMVAAGTLAVALAIIYGLYWFDKRNQAAARRANRPTVFLTFNEIVKDLMTTLSESDKDHIASLPQRDLISLHDTLGRHIRNCYGLWDERNPYVKHHALTTTRDGVITDPMHPDQVSQDIIGVLWMRLHRQPWPR